MDTHLEVLSKEVAKIFDGANHNWNIRNQSQRTERQDPRKGGPPTWPLELYMDIYPSKLLDMDSPWTMSKGPVHIIINDQYCTWTNVYGQYPKVSKCPSTLLAKIIYKIIKKTYKITINFEEMLFQSLHINLKLIFLET